MDYCCTLLNVCQSRLITMPLLLLAWLVAVPTHYQCASVVSAVIYGFLEMTWYRYWTGSAFTTWQQLVMSILYCPIAVCMYRYYFTEPWIRVLLFPVNLWLCEVITGYWLLWMYRGHNPAWSYDDDPWSMFHGTMSLKCMPRWIVFGIAAEFIAVSVESMCSC